MSRPWNGAGITSCLTVSRASGDTVGRWFEQLYLNRRGHRECRGGVGIHSFVFSASSAVGVSSLSFTCSGFDSFSLCFRFKPHTDHRTIDRRTRHTRADSEIVAQTVIFQTLQFHDALAIEVVARRGFEVEVFTHVFRLQGNYSGGIPFRDAS